MEGNSRVKGITGIKRHVVQRQYANISMRIKLNVQSCNVIAMKHKTGKSEKLRRLGTKTICIFLLYICFIFNNLHVLFTTPHKIYI